MILQQTKQLLLAALALMTGVGAVLTGAKLKMVKADIPADPDTPLATYDSNEADFHGYAAKTITWNAPSMSDDGEVEIVGTTTEFRFTAGVPVNDIYDLYMTDAAGATLLGVARYDDPPVPFRETTDADVLTVRYRPFSGGLVVSVG